MGLVALSARLLMDFHKAQTSAERPASSSIV